MRPGGEELGDASSFETCLREAESGAETSTTGSDNDGVVLVIDHGVVADARLALKREKHKISIWFKMRPWKPINSGHKWSHSPTQMAKQATLHEQKWKLGMFDDLNFEARAALPRKTHRSACWSR